MKKQKEKKPRQPMTKQRRRELVIWLAAVAVFLIASILVGSPDRSETVQETMRDAVLHETNRVSLFGIKDVNPGLISAMLVSAFLLVAAALIRIFAIPRFKMIPGKFQLLLEQLVSLFDGLARGSSPHRNGFLGAYIFAAGVYIFTGTLSELIGVQVMATNGHAVTLPAPLSDVNAAIALGCLSYLIILSGGIAGDGVKGVGKTLKEFSLPISMSFRLFGALLSGLLVTELVYYYVNLSFVLPVLVGVLFTLLHALIQSYVLTMLTAMFYGEVSEPSPPRKKKTKKPPEPAQMLPKYNRRKFPMKKMLQSKNFRALALVLALLVVLAVPAFAAGSDDAANNDSTVVTTSVNDQAAATSTDSGSSQKSLASGIAIGLAAAGGAIAMGVAVAKSVEGIARQPEAESKIRTTLMLGLVFIETAIIYALLVVILIIFVL